MDLEYPSHGNVDIVKQLNRLDKLTSKLNLTLKDMPHSEPITKNQKQQIVKYISNDKSSLLLKYMEKEVISADREIGAKGSRWNLLHVCAKYDAVQCVKVLLRKIYQQCEEDYLILVNDKTVEGYTPLMITVIYQSNKTLEVLLRLGGSDLAIMQSSKLRAYDLALNYHNQKAIKELIVYEDRCKKQMYLNKEELGQEVEVVEQKGWFGSVMNCLVDYLLCLNRDEMDNEPANQVLLHKINTLLKGEKGDEKVYEIDSVKIGSRRDIEDYQIEWKKLSQMGGQKFILFDSFKPLDISQNQFTLRNNLILFQALSDYSWIIKRAIHKIDNKSSNKNSLHKFGINLYKNLAAVKFEVDQCIPFIKQRGEIMFLSNQNQIWPQMLQKGLAKLYNSYIQLNGINPSETLQDITGFYSHSLPVSSFTQSTLVTDLQELSMKGYIILLQGRQKTQLNTSPTSQVYSILNYYEKGSTKKILVNCPNVVQRWKQQKQNRQLAIIKSHFNKHNQSCVWIDQSKLTYYFKDVTVCYLRANYLRSQLKIKMKIKQEEEESNRDVLEENGKVVKNYKKAIFFKFKVDKQKIDDPIMLQLVDMETKHRFDLSTLSGWKNDGSQILIHQVESSFCKELTKIIPEPGQYTCMYEISEKQIIKKQKNHSQLNKGIIKQKKEEQQVKLEIKSEKKVKLNLGPEHLRELLLLSWWGQSLQIEYLEQEFGSIEWLSHFKNYSILNWPYLMKERQEEDCFLYETVNKKTILLIKTKQVKKVYMQLLDFSLEEWKQPNSIIQGSFTKSQFGDSIELVRQSKNTTFFYTVISNIPIQDFEREKKIRFLYEYDE